VNDELRLEDAAALPASDRGLRGHHRVHEPAGGRRLPRLRRHPGELAQEIHMDEIAHVLASIRSRCARSCTSAPARARPSSRCSARARRGEQVVRSCGLAECLEQGAAAIGWHERRGRPRGPIRRGVAWRRSCRARAIPEVGHASVSLKLNEDGSCNLLAARPIWAPARTRCSRRSPPRCWRRRRRDESC